MKDKLIIITGPTASGKSDIGIKLAKKINGEIISADSQQVYRDMDIGTSKVVDDFDIAHHMINIVDPNENYSVGEYKTEARSIISQVNKNGKLPILLGGTGFYIDSILFDMNYGQAPKDEEYRAYLEKLADEKGNLFLYENLKEIDLDTAKLYHPNELNRIIRALEIYKVTGEKPSLKRSGDKTLNENIEPIIFFLNYKDRDILYRKINERSQEMVDIGLLEEFNYLIDKYKLDENTQSMFAIGYKEIFPYIKGEISMDEMVEKLQQNTRRYAKRQITWMRKYLSYPFCHEIMLDNLSKDDACLIIETTIKDLYEF
uniref:tRNA (adenosine(37)-N6)-dimethylallyltransferase MiaA n=1 Tax=Anaerococcus mediterraneensis TaxID=1870984 RepID=UPI000930006F|nr:tRNA (adenosine(37)-N6)-dimethylallyltransferase MiaA [Anaerococcus mediterraneensis]